MLPAIQAVFRGTQRGPKQRPVSSGRFLLRRRACQQTDLESLSLLGRKMKQSKGEGDGDRDDLLNSLVGEGWRR